VQDQELEVQGDLEEVVQVHQEVQEQQELETVHQLVHHKEIVEEMDFQMLDHMDQEVVAELLKQVEVEDL
jgi:hypothetical protein